MSTPRLATTILAAGRSSRLGRPKQLLQWNARTLLEHSVSQLAALGQPPLVVLGAYWREIIDALPDILSHVVINEDWRLGMSTSLSAAISRLPRDTAGLLVAVCDQPAIANQHYIDLRSHFRSDPTRAIASVADGIIGVPAIIPARGFADLKQVAGDSGARQWLRQDRNLLTIECPQAALDIDTEDDIGRL